MKGIFIVRYRWGSLRERHFRTAPGINRYWGWLALQQQPWCTIAGTHNESGSVFSEYYVIRQQGLRFPIPMLSAAASGWWLMDEGERCFCLTSPCASEILIRRRLNWKEGSDWVILLHCHPKRCKIWVWLIRNMCSCADGFILSSSVTLTTPYVKQMRLLFFDPVLSTFKNSHMVHRVTTYMTIVLCDPFAPRYWWWWWRSPDPATWQR